MSISYCGKEATAFWVGGTIAEAKQIDWGIIPVDQSVAPGECIEHWDSWGKVLIALPKKHVQET